MTRKVWFACQAPSFFREVRAVAVSEVGSSVRILK